MNCLNCRNPLDRTMQYCYSCGAPVVKRRLTVRSLLDDALNRFFNLERGFFRTFIDLTVKPEEVILGYIQGVRKRYVTPVSYLTLAVFLSGIILLVMARVRDRIDFSLVFGESAPTQEKIMNSVGDLQALFLFMYIPVGALASFLMFPKRRLNFSERSVLFIYALAHFSVVMFIPSLILIELAPEKYMLFSLYTFPLMFLLFVYYIQRVNQLGFWGALPRLLVFGILYTLFFFAASLLMNILLLALGYLEVQDFLPPEAT